MSIQFFAPRSSTGQQVHLPREYRRSVRWQPQIGDIFPDFTVRTTRGDIRFWDYAEGHWTHLFSHPVAFSPVCTTEIAAFAGLRDTFARHDIRHLTLTGSSVEDQFDWHCEMEETFGVTIDWPCAEDPSLELSRCFGMLHQKEAGDHMIRKSFVVGPDLKIRLISEYPMFVGRNSEEVLRVIRAIQMHESTGFATPSDWEEGDCLIVPDTEVEARARRVPELRILEILPYLRVACCAQSGSVRMPVGHGVRCADNLSDTGG
ncbi:Alkyl hydroperoxide reductase subunit AhpC (peroxiredoxin) [Salinihabitans flavidus]|uniref:Alkyl hydroperoxide reductase C n=1 Tax=Salinihabitans flavidus TaxID=569882 RepID=A0A1H8TLZ7_9RHOB|nr:redoxin domain-containing protein [Salinihabitans flavidus]SEO91982.1 Alkyl hydroperoxide reductase subunit AhpC (peroxiredoxin) [Salinihabitans flavidus]